MPEWTSGLVVEDRHSSWGFAPCSAELTWAICLQILYLYNEGGQVRKWRMSSRFIELHDPWIVFLGWFELEVCWEQINFLQTLCGIVKRALELGLWLFSNSDFSFLTFGSFCSAQTTWIWHSLGTRLWVTWIHLGVKRHATHNYVHITDSSWKEGLCWAN